MQRTWRWIALIFIASAFLLRIPLGPLEGTADALAAGEAVTVEEEPWLTFTPVAATTYRIYLL